MGIKSFFSKYLSLKIAALSFTGAAVVAGTVSAAVKSVVNNKISSNNPFVLIFRNGKNKSQDSKYRLLGRHQFGYPNPNLKDKFGGAKPWETELGLGLDDSNPKVQSEQLNWLYYLLFFKQIKNNEKNKNTSLFEAENKLKDPETYFKDNSDASTYDGIRIDCGDAVDSDVLGQTSDLLNDLYNRTRSDADANDHLSYNEGYGPDDAINEKKYFHNSSLNYDDSYYTNMRDSLLWYGGEGRKAPSLKEAKSNMVDWTDDETENIVNPNLTYSRNHDNFNDRVHNIAMLKDPSFTYENYDDKKDQIMYEASEKYYEYLTHTDKTWKGEQISPKNQVALYADLLSNKDTVPILFYGDIFEAEKPYMSTPSAIAEPIMDILSARSKYVSGGQQRTVLKQDNGHIMTNVRFGKGYFDKITPVDNKHPENNAGRNSGIVTVYSNDQSLKPTDVKVYVGLNHKGQQYTNLIDTTSDKKLSNGFGLTLGKVADKSNSTMGVQDNPKYLLSEKDEDLTVDEKGYLTIPDVKGVNAPFVDGYLSMWVPDTTEATNIYVSENTALGYNNYKETGNVLNSNAALDSHVLFQSFTVNMPYQGMTKVGQKGDYYAKLKDNAQGIADSGITDIWMAPPYISPSPNKKGQLKDWFTRYGYGYMMSDRYNLGEGEGTPSKYGTYDQLIDAADALHAAQTKIADKGLNNRGLKLMLDFVPHQIIRGDLNEAVTVDAYSGDYYFAPLHLVKRNVTELLETKTSRKNWQYKYGGLYLETIHNLFPDIFNTPALSTGEILPFNDDDRIRQWSAKYEVAYPCEFGVGSDMSSSYGNDYTNYYDDYWFKGRQ